MGKIQADHDLQIERLLTRIQKWSPPPIMRSPADVQAAMGGIEDRSQQEADWMREWEIVKNEAGDGFLGPDGVLYETVKDAAIELTKKNFPKPRENRLRGRVGGNGNTV